MNKLVFALLLILAAFSVYLSRVGKEHKALEETIAIQNAEIERLSKSVESLRERAEQAETQYGAAVREFKRVGNEQDQLVSQLNQTKEQVAQLEKLLKDTQAELVRRIAQNVELDDRMEQSQKKLQQLQKQLDEAKLEAERARQAVEARPNLRVLPPESGP